MQRKIMTTIGSNNIYNLAIKGTFEAFPRKTKFIKPAKIVLKFGEPLCYDVEAKPSKERINNVKDDIMDGIKKSFDSIK